MSNGLVTNNKPASAPEGIVRPEIPMNQKRAERMAWVSMTLGGLALVASSLVGVGFLPTKGSQVCGWLAGLFTALSWYLARKTPSMASMAAARKNGGKHETR